MVIYSSILPRGIVDNFSVSQINKKLARPYKQFSAYRRGKIVPKFRKYKKLFGIILPLIY
jgi:hypothetical protein